MEAAFLIVVGIIGCLIAAGIVLLAGWLIGRAFY